MGQAAFSLDTVQLFGVALGTTIVLLLLLTQLPSLKLSYAREEPGRALFHPRFFRLGGVALLGGFLGAFFFDHRLVFDSHLQYLILGGLLAFSLGLMDDFFPIPWGWQLGGQILLGALLFGAGMAINSLPVGGGQGLDFTRVPGLPCLLTLLWVVLVMNAVNWMDGIDGLMGGVMSIALATLFILSLRPEVNQPALALLTTMLFGSTVAFLLFNWFPAKIIAGTSGVSFLGFMLAALSVYAGTKVATALLVLGIPILDVFSVVWHRLREGRSPFQPDEEHLHHLLLRLGWSTRQISFVYTLVTLLLAILALTTRQWGKIGVLIAALSLFSVAILLLQWFLTHQKRNITL